MKVKEVLNQIQNLMPVKDGVYCVVVDENKVQLNGPFETMQAAGNKSELIVEIKGSHAKFTMKKKIKTLPDHLAVRMIGLTEGQKMWITQKWQLTAVFSFLDIEVFKMHNASKSERAH